MIALALVALAHAEVPEVVLVAMQDRQVAIERVEGPVVTGTLVGHDEASLVVLQANGQVLTVPRVDVVSLNGVVEDVPPAPTPAPVVPEIVRRPPLRGIQATEAWQVLREDDRERWLRVDMTAKSWFVVGVAGTGASQVLSYLAAITASQEMAYTAGGLQLVATPIMAGSALRSATALRAMGSEVGTGWGIASWVLYGEAIAASVGAAYVDEPAPLVTLAQVGHLGAILAAVVQGGANQRFRRDEGVQRLQDELRVKGSLALVPQEGGAMAMVVVAW